MYQQFFKLKELPFELTASPKYLFLTTRQREALSILQYGLLAGKSLTLLIGEAGTGKTTLLQAALDSDRCRNVRCVYLNNPTLTPADFVSLLARKFELGTEATHSKSVFLEQLDAALRQRRARGERTALVVDEAQSLSTELLEEVRLLSNIETPSEKLLPLVLAGQPELGERLEQTELRQLKQRVALRCELSPFELADTAAYIASRIVTAGGSPAGMFTREAVTLIHERATGIPRTINVICDNALVTAMAAGRHLVDQALVEEVCRDLRLPGLPADAGRPSGRAASQIARAQDAPAAARGGPQAAGTTTDSERRAPLTLTTEDKREPSGNAAEPSDVPLDETTPAPSRFGFRFRWRAASPRTATRIITE